MESHWNDKKWQEDVLKSDSYSPETTSPLSSGSVRWALSNCCYTFTLIWLDTVSCKHLQLQLQRQRRGGRATRWRTWRFPPRRPRGGVWQTRANEAKFSRRARLSTNLRTGPTRCQSLLSGERVTADVSTQGGPWSAHEVRSRTTGLLNAGPHMGSRDIYRLFPQ